MTEEATPSDGLGPALEDAAYDCLSALAGVDTHDVNLRDHGEAWAAIEAFATKVQAAERERLLSMPTLMHACDALEQLSFVFVNEGETAAEALRRVRDVARAALAQPASELAHGTINNGQGN